MERANLSEKSIELSFEELDVVAGGERHQVSKEQYDTLNMVRMVVAGTYKASTNPNDKW